MIKILSIAVCALILSILIKEQNKTIAVLLTLCSACVIFVSVASGFNNILSSLTEMSAYAGEISEYVKLMVKILGICFLSQLIINICKDSGENALASQTELASKIIVVVMLLPLFEALIKIIAGIMK